MIPSGIQFFAWIATMWKGTVKLTTPMLFALGFLLIFLLGGITGVMVAVLPFDYQVTDSYFVVAHFHYVLNGAVVFPIFGALYYWLPKMTGRMLDERLGKISFWTMFVGFNVAFFPMHILGLLGMPRRVYTYPSGLGWDTLNLIVDHRRVRVRPRNRHDPLELRVVPPDGPAGRPRSLGRRLARVGDGIAAAGVQLRRDPGRREPPSALGPTAAAGVRVGRRRGDARLRAFRRALERTTPLTTGLRAEPEATMEIPEETALPFVVAAGIALLFVGLLFSGHRRRRRRARDRGDLAVAVDLADRGALTMTATTHAGTIPMPADGAVPTVRLVAPPPRRGSRAGPAATGASCASSRRRRRSSRDFSRRTSSCVPPRPSGRRAASRCPSSRRSAIMSVILVGSSLPIFLAEHAIKRGGVNTMRVCLMLAFLMGAAFLGHEGYEYAHLEFNWTKNAYSSIFYATTGLHGMHVLIGLLINLQVQIKSWMGKITTERHTSLEVFGLYWHFVDVVWIFVFSSLYVSAHIR